MKKVIKFGQTKAERKLENEKYILMPEEEYLKLEGKEKSKATIIRAAHKRKMEKKINNPNGVNQYTERNKIREFIKNNQLGALEKLNKTLDFTIDQIVNIAANDKVTRNRLYALEILLGYQLSKPGKVVEEAKELAKTLIVLPADQVINPAAIEKAERMRNPEEPKKKK